eukprot:scaffold15482_cov121-Skeletonema_dohrnii-CCMP3373.AAC.2
MPVQRWHESLVSDVWLSWQLAGWLFSFLGRSEEASYTRRVCSDFEAGNSHGRAIVRAGILGGHTVCCHVDCKKIAVPAVTVNTSVGAEDRGLPTTPFDSA